MTVERACTYSCTFSNPPEKNDDVLGAADAPSPLTSSLQLLSKDSRGRSSPMRHPSFQRFPSACREVEATSGRRSLSVEGDACVDAGRDKVTRRQR